MECVGVACLSRSATFKTLMTDILSDITPDTSDLSSCHDTNANDCCKSILAKQIEAQVPERVKMLLKYGTWWAVDPPELPPHAAIDFRCYVEYGTHPLDFFRFDTTIRMLCNRPFYARFAMKYEKRGEETYLESTGACVKLKPRASSTSYNVAGSSLVPIMGRTICQEST